MIPAGRVALMALVVCFTVGFAPRVARPDMPSVGAGPRHPAGDSAGGSGPAATAPATLSRGPGWPADLRAPSSRPRAGDWPAWLLVFRLTDSIQGDSRDAPTIADDLPTRRAEPAEVLPFSLTGAVDDQEASDLRTLIVKGERWHVLRFDSVASWRPLDARVTTFGSIPYLPGDSGAPVSLDDAYLPALLGVTGEVADFEMGVEYRSLGKRLDRVVGAGWAQKDVEGGQVWLAQRFGALRLRLSQSELSDNVDRDPVRARTTKSETAATVELTVPDGPVLSLTYGAGDARRAGPASPPPATARERTTFKSITGSAYYPGPGWDVTASTTYALGQEAAGGETAASYHAVTLALHASDCLTVTPVLSAGSERDATTGVRWDTGSASLTLTYSPPASRWYAWSTIAYGGTRSTDSLAAGAGVSVGGGVTVELARAGAFRSAVSAEAGYDHYQDGVSPANSSLSGFALVRLKVSGF